ncbi:MAG TPA: hypothetical protein VF976_15985 [Gemmatimonadales bacterium]
MKWTLEQAVAVLGIGTSLLRWPIRHQRVLRIVARNPGRVSAAAAKRHARRPTVDIGAGADMALIKGSFRDVQVEGPN